ncbi:hypothetical protein AKO1_002220 [Acrasis kona]
MQRNERRKLSNIEQLRNLNTTNETKLKKTAVEESKVDHIEGEKAGLLQLQIITYLMGIMQQQADTK